MIAIEDHGDYQDGDYSGNCSPTGKLLAMVGYNLDAVLNFQRETVLFQFFAGKTIH
jgi:hypothetical protein